MKRTELITAIDASKSTDLASLLVELESSGFSVQDRTQEGDTILHLLFKSKLLFWEDALDLDSLPMASLVKERNNFDETPLLSLLVNYNIDYITRLQLARVLVEKYHSDPDSADINGLSPRLLLAVIDNGTPWQKPLASNIQDNIDRQLEVDAEYVSDTGLMYKERARIADLMEAIRQREHEDIEHILEESVQLTFDKRDPKYVDIVLQSDWESLFVEDKATLQILVDYGFEVDVEHLYAYAKKHKQDILDMVDLVKSNDHILEEFIAQLISVKGFTAKEKQQAFEHALHVSKHPEGFIYGVCEAVQDVDGSSMKNVEKVLAKIDKNINIQEIISAQQYAPEGNEFIFHANREKEVNNRQLPPNINVPGRGFSYKM